MSEYRKTTADALYFVTLTTAGWMDLFTRTDYKDIIVTNLTYCQQKENLSIYYYVLMTNHLHMICSRAEADLNELLGRSKGFTSKKLINAIEQNEKESRKYWMLYQLRHFAKTYTQYSRHHLWQYTKAYLYSSACPESPLRVSDMFLGGDN